MIVGSHQLSNAYKTVGAVRNYGATYRPSLFSKCIGTILALTPISKNTVPVIATDEAPVKYLYVPIN